MGAWALLGKRLRDHLAVLTVGAALILLVCLTFVYLNSQIGTVQNLEQLWDTAGSIIRNMIRGELPEQFERPSVARFVAAAYWHFIPQVVLLAFPIAVAAQGLAGEVSAGTADLLLAQPVRRGTVYAVTAAVIGVGAVTFAAVSFLTIALGSLQIGTIEPLPLDRFALASCNTGCLCLCAGGVSLLLSASVNQFGRAVLLPAAVMLAMALMEVMGSLWPPMGGARQFGLYYYFSPAQIADGQVPRALRGVLSPPHWAALSCGVLVGVGAACAVIGYLIYRRRDIATL
jgi:ABC-type transport system involved in multi-copper enzyme maturation permease subunit